MRSAPVELDRFDAPVVEDRRTELGVGAEQHVFEPPAIELERRHRREIRRPELDALGDVAVVVVGEEIAEPELFQLRGAKVRLEGQSLLKIMRADFDAGFADLERRFGNWMPPLLDDQYPQRRRFLTELARETSAGETAAEDRDVVVIGSAGSAGVLHRTDILIRT